MIGPRLVVITFISAVAAVVAGFVGGGLVRDAVGTDHEVAVGVVDAQAGVPIATSTPQPVTPEPTDPAPATVDPFATPSVEPSASPSPDGSFEPCPGTPPREGCTCRERKRNSRWVCPLV